MSCLNCNLVFQRTDLFPNAPAAQSSPPLRWVSPAARFYTNAPNCCLMGTHHDWSVGNSAQRLQAASTTAALLGWLFPLKPGVALTPTQVSHNTVFCLFKPTLIERHTEISVILPLLPSCYWGNCCSPGRTAAETRRGGQKVTGKARSVSTGPLNWTHFQSILLWSALSKNVCLQRPL